MQSTRTSTRAIVLVLVLVGFGAFAYQKEHERAASKPSPPHGFTAEERKQFARTYENQLLDKRINAEVTTSGEGSRTLTLKWVMVDRVFAHEMVKNHDQLWSMSTMGFWRFVLTDGYRDSWSIDLGTVPYVALPLR